MQHFSACLGWACSHVPVMSIITAERCLNSVQVKKRTLRWTLYWLQCHRSSEKEPTKSDKADFRKINVFKNVPWLQSSFWGTTTFTQDVALSKDFMNFHGANQDPICAVSKFWQQNSPRIKLLSAPFIWRKSGATHVGIQVLPTPSCRFLKAHTMIPVSLSELRCNFHSIPRAERSSSKLKSIKRDTKIKSSPHMKCKGCCLNHSKPPLQILVLALLGQLRESHMLRLYSYVAGWNLCESSYLPYILAHTICHKVHTDLYRPCKKWKYNKGARQGVCSKLLWAAGCEFWLVFRASPEISQTK